MIDQKMIPPEVVEAAFDAYLKDPCIDKAFFGKAIAAGLVVWPNAWMPDKFDLYELRNTLILPLTEARDDR